MSERRHQIPQEAVVRTAGSGYEVLVGDDQIATFGEGHGQHANDFASGFNLGLIRGYERAMKDVVAMSPGGSGV